MYSTAGISSTYMIFQLLLSVGFLAFSFYLAYTIFKYGQKTGQFVEQGDYNLLEASFNYQLNYWRTMGIFVSVILGFYICAFIVGALAAGTGF
jgi:hypothetical protein